MNTENMKCKSSLVLKVEPVLNSPKMSGVEDASDLWWILCLLNEEDKSEFFKSVWDGFSDEDDKLEADLDAAAIDDAIRLEEIRLFQILSNARKSVVKKLSTNRVSNVKALANWERHRVNKVSKMRCETLQQEAV